MDNIVPIEINNEILKVNFIEFIPDEPTESNPSSGTLKISIEPEDAIFFESLFDKNVDDAIQSGLKTYIHNLVIRSNERCKITYERGYLLDRQNTTYTIYLERILYCYY